MGAPGINAAVTRSANAVELFYTVPTGATSITVELLLNDNPASKINSFTTTSNKKSLLVENLESNTYYFFRAQAVTKCGYSSWSNLISAQTSAANEESAPVSNIEIEPTPTTDLTSPTPQPIATDISLYELSIRIVDQHRQPWKDVKVIMHSSELVVQSDDRGIVNFADVTPGQHEVYLEALSLHSTQTIYVDGPSRQVYLTLTIDRPPLWWRQPQYNITGSLLLGSVYFFGQGLKGKKLKVVRKKGYSSSTN